MSEASPGAAWLLTDYGNAPVGNETPAFIAWLDTGLSTLTGRKRQLAFGTDSRHFRLPENLRNDKAIILFSLLLLNM